MNTDSEVTRTRILLPHRRPDLLTRERLFDLLNGFIDKKLTLVTAPAGYGKTSLLVDFTSQSGLPVCWYAIDAMDREPERFLAHFIAAINHRFPRFGQISKAALDNLWMGQASLDSITTSVINDVYENISEHFLVVLDDFHLVEENKSIAGFISRFCQDGDEACHTIIASRTLISLPDLPLMVARANVGGLDFEELAFRPEEIQALFLQNYQRVISDESAEQLARQSEGWITGLLLSPQFIGKDGTIQARVARSSGVGLTDYFSQILSSQPEIVQKFLVFSSLMGEFDAALCDEVLSPHLNPPGNDWEPFLETVLRRNLFVLPVGEEGLWLRYHHLFQDYLNLRMRREHPDLVPGIQGRLAESFTRREEWDRAFQLLAALGDREAMVNLIIHAGGKLMASGRLEIVSGWLEALPREITEARPDLAAIKAHLAVLRGDLVLGLRLFEMAIPALREAGRLDSLAVALTHRSGALRLRGEYDAALKDAQEALAINTGQPDNLSSRAEILRAVGMVYYQKGELATALDCLNQASEIFQTLGDKEALAKLSVDQGLVQRVLGNYPAAEEAYRQALDFLQSSKNYPWQANLLNNLSMLQSLTGDYEEAAVNLDKALEYARLGGYPRMEAFALASMGDLYQTLDEDGQALEAYQQARMVAESVNEGLLLIYIDLGEAGIAARRRNYPRAFDHLDQALRRAGESGSKYELALCQVEKGILLTRQGRKEQAASELTAAAGYFQESSNGIAEARAQFYLAIADHACGRAREAYHHLERALSLTRVLGNRAYISSLGYQERETLEDLFQDEPLKRPVGRLLKEVKRFEQAISGTRRRIRSRVAGMSFAGPQIHIYGLGSIKVEISLPAGSAVEWETTIARDLFFMLLTYPNGLTRDVIASLFWPDATENEVKNRFKNNIYRLRRALGNDAIVLNEDTYFFNNALDYEYDVESFQQHLDSAYRSTLPDEKINHLQLGLDLYKGPFLPDLDGSWVVPERERLAMAHLEALLNLSDLYLQNQQFAKALQLCQRALVEDACLEAAYRAIMRIYGAMGNRAAVKRQYRRCKKVLTKEIKAPPSEETDALYHALMH